MHINSKYILHLLIRLKPISYHLPAKSVITYYTYIYICISSAVMDSNIYLMKVNRIWHLKAGGAIYSLSVQTHNVTLFFLGFLHECLVQMPVPALCQGVAYVWCSKGWLLHGQEDSDMISLCISSINYLISLGRGPSKKY